MRRFLLLFGLAACSNAVDDVIGPDTGADSTISDASGDATKSDAATDAGIDAKTQDAIADAPVDTGVDSGLCGTACRTFSDYCGGCTCLSLPSTQPDPTCDAGLVKCFVDPCLNKQAVCTNNGCVLQ